MENEKQNTSASPERLAANRANAQRSTGPRTAAGKERSSQNAWRHGFFAKRLFATPEQEAEDRAEYELIVQGVRDHYQPIGFMENLWAERIAAELLRSARVLSYEQGLFLSGSFNVFESNSVDRVLRFHATVNRQLALDIEELEHLQEKRRAKSNQGPPPDAEVDTPADEPQKMEGRAEEDPSAAGLDLSQSGNYPTESPDDAE